MCRRSQTSLTIVLFSQPESSWCPTASKAAVYHPIWIQNSGTVIDPTFIGFHAISFTSSEHLLGIPLIPAASVDASNGTLFSHGPPREYLGLSKTARRRCSHGLKVSAWCRERLNGPYSPKDTLKTAIPISFDLSQNLC